MKKNYKADCQQITKNLSKVDLGWLKSEQLRLSKKGWNTEIRDDGFGRIALWRI
jgi:hypothetical protein